MYRRQQPRPFISQDEFILMEIMRSKKEREQPNESSSFLPPVETPIVAWNIQPIHPHPHQRIDDFNSPPIQPTQQFNRSSDRRKVNKQTNNVVANKNHHNQKQVVVENKSNENLQTNNMRPIQPIEETPVFNFFSDTVEKPIVEEAPVFNFLSEPTNEILVELSSESRVNNNIEASKTLKAFLTPSTSSSLTSTTTAVVTTTTPLPVVSVTASNNLKSLLLAKPETISEKPLNTASVASLKSLLLSGTPAPPITPSKTSYASITKKPVSTAAPVSTEKPPSVQKKGLAQALSKAVKSAPAPEPKANQSATTNMPRSASTGQGQGQGIEKFASSKMLSSPDPLNLPLPDFEESFFS